MTLEIDKERREEGNEFFPKFDAKGLLTAMVVDASSRAPLMLAHMNREAIELTLKTGEAHFYSRSRQEIWHKGATSGNTLTVRNILTDCDQDALWLEVDVAGDGAACHTQRRSCFYRQVAASGGKNSLTFVSQ